MFYHHGAATTAAVSRGEGKGEARRGHASARALMSQDEGPVSTSGSPDYEITADGVHLGYGKRGFRLLCCSVFYDIYDATRPW